MSEFERAHALYEEIYYYHSAGGHCHIALDDENLSDHQLEFCLKYIDDNFDDECAEMLCSYDPEEETPIGQWLGYILAERKLMKLMLGMGHRERYAMLFTIRNKNRGDQGVSDKILAYEIDRAWNE